MNISIVIPTFNGKHTLEKYLPSVIKACQYYSFEKTEIIIADDASSDDTCKYLALEYPFIKLIKNRVNQGFAVTANSGMFAAINKFVVLLNNDVEIEKDFLIYIPQNFDDDNIFAVRPYLKDAFGDGFVENQRVAGGFRYGFFDVPKKVEKEIGFAFFAGGGAAAYDKKKFAELGGFDEMFSPFYYEDVDLSYRAWKRGWKIIYESRCLAYHKGGTTISKLYKQSFIDTVGERNKYFLVWKNITDRKFILQHFIFIPIRIVISLIRGKFVYIAGFIKAAKQIKEIIRKRKLERRFLKVNDAEIFGIFKQ